MSREKGFIAEEKAVSHLSNKGFKIIEKNFYIKGGEIDIIAVKDNILHFVEVKSGENYEAVYNLTAKKISRVIKTANVYMKKNSLDMPFCIDGAVVVGDTVELIENITM